MTHPAVSLCAVVGVPDERLGEDVKAFVVRKPGAAGDRGRDRRLVPRAAWPPTRRRATSSSAITLPMGATGKVLKRGPARAAAAPAAAIGSLRNRISGAAARKIASSVG